MRQLEEAWNQNMSQQCFPSWINVIDYSMMEWFKNSHKESADQMSTTWEKLVYYVITIHGHEISNKLLNKNTVTIATPDNTQYVLDEHQLATKIRDQSYERLAEAQHL